MRVIDITQFTELHQVIREVLEQELSGWRITKITEQSSTAYSPTLETRTAPEPTYILAEVFATFDIEAVENAPVDRMIEYNPLPGRIPLKTLSCKASLMSTGHLAITDRKVEES